MEYQMNDKVMGFPSFEESHPNAPLYYKGELVIKGLLIREVNGAPIPMCYGYTIEYGTVEVLANAVSAAYLEKFGRQPVPFELIGLTIRISRPRRVVERDGEKHKVREYHVDIL